VHHDGEKNDTTEVHEVKAKLFTVKTLSKDKTLQLAILSNLKGVGQKRIKNLHWHTREAKAKT
jgi:hypothetical protein